MRTGDIDCVGVRLERGFDDSHLPVGAALPVNSSQYYFRLAAWAACISDFDGRYSSDWILLAGDPALLDMPAIQDHAVDLGGYSTDVHLWTDDYSNLFRILK